MKLSEKIGPSHISWRYDPILVNDKYTVEKHIAYFEKISAALSGYTDTCVISFIDIYEKVRRNFQRVQEVCMEDRIQIGKVFSEIGNRYGIEIKSCAEGKFLEKYGIDCNGCMSIDTYEKSLGFKLNVPYKKELRSECECFLGNDIGAYNTCGHLCKYCYANYDENTVFENMKKHDSTSPLLIGNLKKEDIIHIPAQKSWINRQMTLDMWFNR